MVTTLAQLDHGSTIITPLPPLRFSHVDQVLCSLIIFALLPFVPLKTTFLAHFGLTLLASPFLAAGCTVFLDVFRLDPGATTLSRAVETVLSGEFSISPVPECFE